jgi:hypothetical protein
MKRNAFVAWLFASVGTAGTLACSGTDAGPPPGPGGADGSPGVDAAVGVEAVGEDAAAGADAAGPRTLGVACTSATACASGFCASGVCCDAPCDGLCQACSHARKGTGADGTCGEVGARRNDSLDRCVDQGAASCGTDGHCDGAGACELYASGTVCLAAHCGAGIVPWGSAVASASLCDGAGTCTTGGPTACLPYRNCDGPVCATTCAADGDCLGAPSGHASFTCDAGHCMPGRDHGEACTAGDQCNSGECTADDGGAGTCI